MKLIDASTGELLAPIDRPAGVFGRAKGLIGSREPPMGRALALRTKQIHTFGLGFPIDAVYLRRDGTVIRVMTIRPGRVGPLLLRARWVLEMAPGEAERLGIRAGRVLRLEQ